MVKSGLRICGCADVDIDKLELNCIFRLRVSVSVRVGVRVRVSISIYLINVIKLQIGGVLTKTSADPQIRSPLFTHCLLILHFLFYKRPNVTDVSFRNRYCSPYSATGTDVTLNSVIGTLSR